MDSFPPEFHQDYTYWQCVTPDLITIWIPLDDVTIDNGCLQYIPKSHKSGLVNLDSVDRNQAVPIEIKAGNFG